MNVEQSDYEYGISFIRNCVSEMKKAVMSRCVGISESFVVEKVFDAAISRAFEQQPEGREAAAWMICYPDGDRRVALSPETSSPGATVRPLVYGDTTPPASVPEADGCWVGTITAEAGGAIDWRGGVHALYRDFAPGTKLYAGGKPDQPGEKVRGLVEKWLVEVEKYAGTHAYVEGMRKCADELAAALSAKGEGE